MSYPHSEETSGHSSKTVNKTIKTAPKIDFANIYSPNVANAKAGSRNTKPHQMTDKICIG